MKTITFLIALIVTGYTTAQAPFSLSYNSPYTHLESSSVSDNRIALISNVSTEISSEHILSLIENGSPKWNKKLNYGEGFPANYLVCLEPVTGNVYAFYADVNDVNIIVNVFKLDYASGSVLWSKKITVPPSDQLSGISFYDYIENFNISAEGTIQISLSFADHLRFIELSNEGQLLISKKINNVDDIYTKNPGFCLNKASNGNYLVSLKDDNWPTIASLNPDFTVAWSQKWSFESYSHPKIIQQLSNGKIVVAGLGDYGFFIALLASDGTMEKYLRTDGNHYLNLAKTVTEINSNRLLIGTENNTYIVVDLITNQWKYYTLPQYIRFEKTEQELCAILVNYNNGMLQVIPNFDPENPTCVTVDSILQGTFVNVASLNAIEHNIPFYFKNNGEISITTISLEDFAVTNSYSCILDVSPLELTTLKVFPNPTNSASGFTVELSQSAKDCSLILTDVTGKIISTLTVNGIFNTINTTDVEKGIYFIQLINTSGEKMDSKRIVIQ